MIGTYARIALLLPALASSASAQWPQWGGKDRDFVADSKELAVVWPEEGPKKVWSRTLGEGYSSIAFADDCLYTMYREPFAEIAADAMGPTGASVMQEIVVALDAQTGQTLWEYKYAAPMPVGMPTDNIKGPNATPLVYGGRVYTFGVCGKLHCLDQKTGKLVWSHDVLAEFAAKIPSFGFASSPLIYKDRLILPVGGPGVGIIAFDAASGDVQWKKHDFAGTCSSPIVIRLDGKDEMVLLAGSEVLGMDPEIGNIEWRYPFQSTIMTPVWGDDGILFISSIEHGSRGLKLTRKDGKVHVEEIWATKEMRVHYTNAVRIGKVIIGCSGLDTECSMAAIDAATGKTLWEEPGFNLANVVVADGKLIILNSGSLTLATATADAFLVKSKFPLLKKSIWSNPTIVGQRFFARDHEAIVALDLGK